MLQRPEVTALTFTTTQSNTVWLTEWTLEESTCKFSLSKGVTMVVDNAQKIILHIIEKLARDGQRVYIF